MFNKHLYARLVISVLCAATLASCTTVTRRDGSQVRIPAGGFVGSMAATNIACQDNVQSLTDENAKLRVQVAGLEAKLNSSNR